MDYEKAYKESLKRAKKELKTCGSLDCDAARQIFRLFPELKNSEDERIRKWLICGMNALKEQKNETFATIPIDDAIAWLEKQGEQRPINDTDEDIVDAIKDTSILDMIEPKFHEGDWVSNGRYTRKIVELYNDNRHYMFEDGSSTRVSNIDRKYHLWTIQDVKNGDVLSYETDTELRIFIYKDGHIHYHCCYYHRQPTVVDSFFVIQKQLLNYIHPATKIQRVLLFAKIKEAGYKWDADKKELKKISQRMVSAEAKEAMYDRPSWSEEDEGNSKNILYILNQLKGTLIYEEDKTAENSVDWLKSLKDRMKGE